MALVNINPNDWLEAMKKEGSESVVTRYIEKNPEDYFNPVQDLYPRAWHFAARMFAEHPRFILLENIKLVEERIAEAIGEDLALFLVTEFQQEDK